MAELQEFKINLTTQVVVEWTDDESPKRVTFDVQSNPQLVAAVLTMENNWGTISLRGWDQNGQRRSIVWCDGTGSARRHHAARRQERPSNGEKLRETLARFMARAREKGGRTDG